VVYAYDQRGNGRSGGQRGHVMRYQELVDELDAFLKLAYAAEPGIERVIYAHSTGAILALTYLYDHPEAADRVILSAPCLILTFEAPAAKVFIGKVFSSILPKVTLQAGFDPGSVSRDPVVVEANKTDELVTQAISTRFYTEVYGKAMPAALARIEELKLPTLVIQGTGDLLVSPKVADEFEKRVPNATIKRYEGGYHESHNDIQREQVFVDVDAWLAQER
jgi:alpha-beta hydrolase superfamily lysophospholipase